MTIEDYATFCKKKGFVFRSSDIYGGFAGFFDLGPYGVELMNNIRQSWWKHFVQEKENMVGMEASIISHPRTWKASGHLDNFGDLILTCSKCKEKVRADHFIEDAMHIHADGMKAADINNVIKQQKLKCPKCKGEFEELKNFNLLFETKVGAEADSSASAYLRGETAQGMFMDFKLIQETSRMPLPFGIAQIGRCFRNEIAPRDFLFRSREFHIAEFEFFIHPDETKCNILGEEQLKVRLRLLSAERQEEGKDELEETTIKKMLDMKKLDEWHAYWLAEQLIWLKKIGLSPDKLKVREHVKTELSHYSSATFDIDYQFPFGSKELAGNANRGQYDLNQHIKESKQSLELFDEASKKKIIPRVIEPTFGMERVFLAVLIESYHDDKERGNIVLKMKPNISAMKIGVFPLVNKLDDEARELFRRLKKEFTCTYDKSGSIGRRYARADELGIPFCITVDFETSEDRKVTIRDRDTTVQYRIAIDRLIEALKEGLDGGKLGDYGEAIEKKGQSIE